MLSYHVIRASIYWNLPKPVCNSKSIANTQNTGSFVFFWLILGHKDKIDNHREPVPFVQNFFLNIVSVMFILLWKLKGIPLFQQLNILFINVLESSSSSNADSVSNMVYTNNHPLENLFLRTILKNRNKYYIMKINIV